MGLYRKQRPDESDNEYVDYREARRLENSAHRKAHDKAYSVKNRYGLTVDEYDSLLSSGCQVCGSFERLTCDHDHDTGLVRGCLCDPCNRALGTYEKRILPNLDKFTQYLRGTL
jgi:hypothetical protein